MKLAERVDKIEAVLVTHLEESGTIRTDLAWLKKAFWTIAIALITAVVSQFLTLGGRHDQQNMSEVQQVSRNH